ncbi:MAG: hypothetical protein O3A81_03295 [bacterium]|nr:hypothetical protein [bacterium]
MSTMRIIRGIIKTAIALFVVFHMSATFMYSLYHVDGVPVLEWLFEKRTHIRPYVLATSQWQRWNLFSPDPLRRVIEMEFDQKTEGEWVNIFTLNEHNVTWFQRAPELKIMRRMEEENMRPLQERYVHDFCKINSVPEGTEIRLRKRWHVIPGHDKTQSRLWWSEWQPDWGEIELLQTTCPELS